MRVTTGIFWLVVFTAIAAPGTAACGSGTDQSPTPSPTLTEVESTSSPGDKPGANPAASSPTTEPQNPFHFSGPPGTLENLAGAAGLDAVAPVTDIADIMVQIPATHLLAPADLARFKLVGAQGRWNSNGFASSTLYIDDTQRQAITIDAWNKVGDFNLVVVPNSPVDDYKLTTIDGIAAFSILPSTNVVGGAGPRTVYLYYAGVIYAIHGEGFVSEPSDSFMSLVHNFIGELKK